MARSTLKYVGLTFVLASVSLLILLVHISSLTTIHLKHIQGSTVLRTGSWYDGRNCSYPPSYHDPWYKPLDGYKEVRFVFYKKDRMEVAARIALERGWTLHRRTIKTLAELETIISKEESFVVIFTSSREVSTPTMTPYLNSPRVLVTAIPFAYRFIGPKREQYLNFDEHLSHHGCSIARLRLMPSSYLMDIAHHCHDFFDRIKGRHDPGLWLQKTSQGYGGKGVSIIKNLTTFQQKYSSCRGTKELIVQEYITDALLLDGRKFDIRVFVLISGTKPYMMFYHNGYLRVAIQPFDINGPMENHLTNTHIQSRQKDYQPDSHFWSFERFQSYLDDHYRDNDKFVNRKLIPYVEALGVLIINSGMSVMERSLSSCLLVGLDIMVSTNYHLWFIEANNYPLWPRGGWMTEFSFHMGVRQEPKQFLNMSVGHHYLSWRLIWREQVPNCEGHNSEYNPCQDLSKALYS